MSKSLNHTIARIHQTSQQFAGLYIAVAKFVALSLSAVSVASGIAIYALQSIQVHVSSVIDIVHNALLVAAFLIIGIALSFLIEGLTISNCARLRTHIADYQDLKRKHATIEDKTATIVAKKQEQLRATRREALPSALFILVASLMSTLASTLFWNYVLHTLPPVESLLYSIVFSLLISFTLVWSELATTVNDRLVKESISNTGLLQLATSAAIEARLLALMSDVQFRELQSSLSNERFIRAATRQTELLLDRLVADGDGSFADELAQEREKTRVYEERAIEALCHNEPLHTNVTTVRKEGAEPSITQACVAEQTVNNERDAEATTDNERDAEAASDNERDAEPVTDAAMDVSSFSARYTRKKVREILEDTILLHGLDYVHKRRNAIAQRLGISVATLYRHLSDVLEAQE